MIEVKQIWTHENTTYFIFQASNGCLLWVFFLKKSLCHISYISQLQISHKFHFISQVSLTLKMQSLVEMCRKHLHNTSIWWMAVRNPECCTTGNCPVWPFYQESSPCLPTTDTFNTVKPEQNECYLTGDILACIMLKFHWQFILKIELTISQS